MDVFACDGVQGPQHFYCLGWEGSGVFLAFFHSLRRNTPEGLVQVELRPLGLDRFIWSTQSQPHEAVSTPTEN